jgi:hypothetical protein
LTRGPVHEAYAEPVAAAARATPIITKQPPALLEEVPADQKPEGDVQWIPGYWAWDDDRNDFLWVSGFWRLPPPGRDWIPGHWAGVDGGWQWAPGFWAESNQQELAYYPPPPDPVDAGPSVPAPTATSVFVPGNWVYRETRYAWRPGFWSDYRPGWVWIPAHYVWTPAGYLYVEGYWDYPLRERGLLFAPVAIDFDLAFRPHWFYQPRYVVNDDCLLGALFVNSECDHYYFGDYFDAGYRGRGFISWLAFRFGRGGYDPLYGYYRSSYGADSPWEHGLRDLYAGRFSGEFARPPRTLIEQNTVVQNITNNTINNTTINNVSNVTNINNVTMVTPLSGVDPGVAQLQPVSEQGQQAALRTARERLVFAGQRTNLESKLLTQALGDTSGRAGTVKTTATPQVVKVSLPRTQGDKTATASKAPAPLTAHSGVKAQLPSAPSGTKPQATAVNPGPRRPVAQSTTTTPGVKTAPAKVMNQHLTLPPSATKPAAKPQVEPAKAQAAPAAKGVSQQRVTHPPAPAAKVQAAPAKVTVSPSVARSPAPKPAVKPQASPAKPVASHAVAQPATPKPAVKPQIAPAAKPAAKPQPAPAPKAAAKPQPALTKPVSQHPAAQPAPKPAVRSQPAPALKAVARAQPAPAPKPAPRPQSAPAKPQAAPARPPAQSARPAPQPAAKPSAKPTAGNSKDRHH